MQGIKGGWHEKVESNWGKDIGIGALRCANRGSVLCERPCGATEVARRLPGGCGILLKVCECKRRDTVGHL